MEYSSHQNQSQAQKSSDSTWQRFTQIRPPETWRALESAIHLSLSSTSSSRPFLSQREKRKVHLDPLPYCIDQEEWASLCHGLTQRTLLLNAILKDLYGEQRVCKSGHLNLQELFSLPNYVLNSHGCTGMKAPQLNLFHVVVQRTAFGFKVLEDITSTPRQLGLVLEHRLVLNQHLGAAENLLKISRLAPWFRQFRENLYEMSDGSSMPSFGVMLTQGIDSDTSFDEVSYLSHYLGIPTVEASDLVVRDHKVYMKNLGSLQQVHFILRRVPEVGLDPLEMQDSAPYGIPGIMDALRHGGVFMDSIPGVGILEKKVLFDHMNELCPMLMGEPLQIPQSSEELYTYDDPWPSLKDGAVSDLNYRLQLTISCFGDKVSILPGGLAFAKHPQSPKPHVKDIWVCGKEDAPYQSLMTQQTFSSQQHFGAGLPSRVADSTLWFGRYLERADCLCRLLREILVEPQRESFSSPTLETHEHLDMVHHALEIPISEEASSWQQRWSSLVSAPDLPGNLRFNLNGIQHNALVLQDRISTDMVNLAQGITKVFETPIPLERGEWLLTQTIEKCAGLTGLSIDSMTHCDEWYFLLLGRRLERATTTLALISTLLKQEGNTPVHWELLLRTFDSIMTYRWRYRIQFEPISVIELMVKDTTNPRSVIFQIQNMIQTLQSLSTKGSIWASEPCRELQETFDALLKRELHQNITGDDQPWEWLEELYQKLLNSYDKITKILHHL